MSTPLDLLRCAVGQRAGGRGVGFRRRRGYTLIEILIVVVILALLATIVVAQFAGASEQASTSSIEMQMSRIRAQIEYYRAQQQADPDLIGNQWADLVGNEYLQQDPINLLNGSTLIAGAAGPAVGWVWRDGGNGTFDLYATDETFIAEYIE